MSVRILYCREIQAFCTVRHNIFTSLLTSSPCDSTQPWIDGVLTCYRRAAWRILVQAGLTCLSKFCSNARRPGEIRCWDGPRTWRVSLENQTPDRLLQPQSTAAGVSPACNSTRLTLPIGLRSRASLVRRSFMLFLRPLAWGVPCLPIIPAYLILQRLVLLCLTVTTEFVSL